MPATQLAVPHTPGQSFQPSGSAPSRRVGSWATQIPAQPSSVAPSHGRRPSCGAVLQRARAPQRRDRVRRAGRSAAGDRVGRVRAAGREDQRPGVEVAGGREAPCSGELPETLERGPGVADAAVVLGVVDRDGRPGGVSRPEHDGDALPVGLVVEAGDAADAEARAAERAAARAGRVVGQVPPVVEIDQAVAALGIRQRVGDVDVDAARDTGVRHGMAVERQVVEAAP